MSLRMLAPSGMVVLLLVVLILLLPETKPRITAPVFPAPPALLPLIIQTHASVQAASGAPAAEAAPVTSPAPAPAPVASASSLLHYTDQVTGMEFVFVKGGCYRMGDTMEDNKYPNEKPVHEVCVKDFWLGKYEVTQRQWMKIMGSNPSNFRNGGDYPVENVSWNDAQNFITKLNRQTNGSYSLPGEAQWEYACREGGKDVRFGTGTDSINSDVANFDAIADYKKTYAVGSFKPNGLGIYDMSGNVSEWVEDKYANYDDDAYKKLGRDNPVYTGKGDMRVNRGGSWFENQNNVRCAYRFADSPGRSSHYLGLRLKKEFKPQATAPVPSATPSALTPLIAPTPAAVQVASGATAAKAPAAATVAVAVTVASVPSLLHYTDRVTGMEFVFVKGGCYRMGDAMGDNEYPDERPVHEVCVNDFWLGKYEVTQRQWMKIMGSNPSSFRNGDDYPVENVSWNDAQKFITKLNRRTDGKYRLPDEAQWEYACRDRGKDVRFGTDTDRINSDVANFDVRYKQTRAVGSFKPNGLGLYDMSGNVSEWVEDKYANYDDDAYKKLGRDNPVYTGKGDMRVNRGGSWFYGQKDVRCAVRGAELPGYSHYNLGLRLKRVK
ncbi:MAG: formylglycine-generating enzyme family protein [Nitrospirae bacterium]|nr:formylglycine-generating enzyme family protein [Nitrospirota bacterium]